MAVAILVFSSGAAWAQDSRLAVTPLIFPLDPAILETAPDLDDPQDAPAKHGKYSVGGFFNLNSTSMDLGSLGTEKTTTGTLSFFVSQYFDENLNHEGGINLTFSLSKFTGFSTWMYGAGIFYNYNAPINPSVTLFFGGSLGVALSDAGTTTSTDFEVGLTFLGVRVQVADKTTFDVRNEYQMIFGDVDRKSYLLNLGFTIFLDQPPFFLK